MTSIRFPHHESAGTQFVGVLLNCTCSQHDRWHTDYSKRPTPTVLYMPHVMLTYKVLLKQGYSVAVPATGVESQEVLGQHVCRQAVHFSAASKPGQASSHGFVCMLTTNLCKDFGMRIIHASMSTHGPFTLYCLSACPLTSWTCLAKLFSQT